MKCISIICTLFVAGCTGIKINSDGSGSYRNGLFDKQVGEAMFIKSGTNVTLKVTGIKSESRSLIEGLEIMRQAYTGQQSVLVVTNR